MDADDDDDDNEEGEGKKKKKKKKKKKNILPVCGQIYPRVQSIYDVNGYFLIIHSSN